MVRWNALFALGLTHVLLPQLRATPGPTVVQAIGSFASEVPPPRVALYSASKFFLKGLMRALDADERAFSPKSDVHFTYLVVGQVQSNVVQKETSWMTPSSDQYAPSVVDKIGLRTTCITPYPAHAISQWAGALFGEQVALWLVRKVMEATWQESVGKKSE